MRAPWWTGHCFSLLIFLASFVNIGCVPNPKSEEIARFPIDSLDGIITKAGAELDRENSSDGKGSLRIITPGPAIVRLFELYDISVDNAKLTYRARLKTEEVEGQVYLEMRCSFPGRGEVNSIGLQQTLSGTTTWTTVETVMVLQKGEKPDLIKLNIVINGQGRVWIDDIRLIKTPLR